ncbi:MAG: GAF domain-containing sensor histidine kinase [Synechococcales bacterium]|nr:GAF domain-containing sensor histidine kinase [Synechococcales bacterium]
MQRRPHSSFRDTFILYAAFIGLCGLTHLINVWTLWYSNNWLFGLIKALTAVVSVSVVFQLIAVVPRALALPSAAQLEATNQELANQVAERQRAANALQQALDYEALLKRISDKVRDSLDESQILQTAVQALGEGLDVLSCNAALYDLNSKTAIVHYEHTNSTVPVQGRVISMDNSPQIYAQLLAGEHFQFCSLYPNPARGQVAMLACPIMDDNSVIGDLWLIHDKGCGFKDLEIRLIQQVSNQCAIAIRQARLLQSSQAQVRELQRLNQLKDDFLSTVSHELRTPVANIKLASRMLAMTHEQRTKLFADSVTDGHSESGLEIEQDIRRKESHYLQVLQNECQREIQLIDDLLDLQRLETKAPPLVNESIDLQAWLPQVVKPFENRADSRNQHLILTLNSQHPLNVCSDQVSLGRIVTELLNNACKYTPPGEKILVEAIALENQVEIIVTNSGVEIPAKEIAFIFDKFYRVPSTDPWRQGGTGLGLALVKKLIECLSGEIAVESKSQFTKFTVTLPRSRSVPEDNQPESEGKYDVTNLAPPCPDAL